ncbi:hypothetical protein L0P88_04070 [Muricauda sp. SCSIO 64092]|uniref:hypothetical protein n=1 Tax=Allomuricauda sp. SCSIO 64092 TaxID=2908842 RepID=UPI001FF623DE|nr:hypothetical protein [Muricauda sp. SCSIO 64092]UOY07731.1 hypothetical protein L0P88_04070 [Muricauda sp. SCSIO 64092]
MELDALGILIKVVLGLLGIIIYAVWKVKEHLSQFQWKKFIGDNKAFWLWSISMVLLLLMVVTIEPNIATAIKTLIGLDISNEPASFFSLGWALALAANGAVKKKLDKKNIEK